MGLAGWSVITSLTWDLLHSATFLVLLTAFRLCLASVLFWSDLFTLSLCNFFQHFPVFRWDHRDPKQRSHFPPCTYMLGSSSKRERERERERERKGKRGMRLAHTVFYKISFEHSKIWEKKTSDIIKMSWVLLGSYCPFPEKKGIDAIPAKWPIFYSKLTIKRGVNYK